MTIQQNILPLKDLNLTHRFLFDEVMEDFQTHQDALSIIMKRFSLSKEEAANYLREYSKSIR